MRHRTFRVLCLLLVFFSRLASAQTYPLSEVEVRLVYTPHGGCLGRCVTYQITVRGDGTVEYNGTGLVEGVRSRTVSPDEVVWLVNQFLEARFWNALNSYRNTSVIVRNGDTVTVNGTSSADDPQTDLTLKIGDRTKTVSLFAHYPDELRRLAIGIERLGGPHSWQ